MNEAILVDRHFEQLARTLIEILSRNFSNTEIFAKIHKHPKIQNLEKGQCHCVLGCGLPLSWGQLQWCTLICRPQGSLNSPIRFVLLEPGLGSRVYLKRS